MGNERVAYKGAVFAIEWYFNARGRSLALEYFESLSFERQKRTFFLFRWLCDVGKIFNEEKFRYEGEAIYAFKPAPDRFLCFFFEGSRVIVTNAYEKKSAKMPRAELLKAVAAKKDYEIRFEKGK